MKFMVFYSQSPSKQRKWYSYIGWLAQKKRIAVNKQHSFG